MTVTPAGIERVRKRMAMDRMVEAPKVCPKCQQRAVLPVLTREDIDGLINWAYRGYLVQDALPHWSSEQREVLQTGYHRDCLDETLPPEGDDD